MRVLQWTVMPSRVSSGPLAHSLCFLGQGPDCAHMCFGSGRRTFYFQQSKNDPRQFSNNKRLQLIPGCRDATTAVIDATTQERPASHLQLNILKQRPTLVQHNSCRHQRSRQTVELSLTVRWCFVMHNSKTLFSRGRKKKTKRISIDTYLYLFLIPVSTVYKAWVHPVQAA